MLEKAREEIENRGAFGDAGRAVKSIFKYICVFIITFAILTGLLVLSACIPRSSIQAHVRESAEYLCQGELFGAVVDGVSGSRIDRYADSILLAIAYQYDAEQPLSSVMWSSYYYTPYQNENDNLLEAVTEGYEANRQYLRYWHGSNAIVRPLLMFFHIQEIYRLNGVILAALIAWLLSMLIRKKAYVPAIGIAAGLILSASWFVPFSLEYTWTYLVMLVMSIVGVKLCCQGNRNFTGVFFLVGGMVTSYLDFLTTETLTLLVPLLLILWTDIHWKEGIGLPELVKRAGKAAVAWGIGYVGMWCMKWVMASLVLQENVMPYVSEHIGERLGGDIGFNIWQYVTGAVLNNVRCLFPLEYGTTGMIASAVVCLVAAYMGYVYHKRHICRQHILLYALVGSVPYIRYMVLHNHSYIHYFFTYRAQMATIFSLALILEEIIDWRWLSHKVTGKK